MTPLAKALAKLRFPIPNGGAAAAMKSCWRHSHDVKCFEVTAVAELSHELAQQAFERGSVVEALAFLPAPVTWLEQRYTRADGSRALQAYLLVDKGDNAATVVSTIGVDINGRTTFIPIPLGSLRLLDAADPMDGR